MYMFQSERGSLNSGANIYIMQSRYLLATSVAIKPNEQPRTQNTENDSPPFTLSSSESKEKRMIRRSMRLKLEKFHQTFIRSRTLSAFDRKNI